MEAIGEHQGTAIITLFNDTLRRVLRRHLGNSRKGNVNVYSTTGISVFTFNGGRTDGAGHCEGHAYFGPASLAYGIR